MYGLLKNHHSVLAAKYSWLVWNLINFKWARGSHPHHNMTSVFEPMCSRMGTLHIGHITDPTVIWPVWGRVEKEPSRLFVPNHFVPIFKY